ncbi:MAG TPA: ISLre2 family transposase, partial [Bacilli bacterium]|nr:ISLre2 family transposase [Bacilli bacterium]
MNKNNTQFPSLKELEQMLWRKLQETFSNVMTAILEEYDQQIAQERDKGRYHLKDSRPLKVDSLFGEIELKRNYYKDRETGEYVYLLDRY